VWEGGEREQQLYLARTDDSGSRELGLKNATLLSISRNGELAIRLNTVTFSGYARIGTLARVPLSGGTPREVLENVQDADWSANGESIAIGAIGLSTVAAIRNAKYWDGRRMGNPFTRSPARPGGWRSREGLSS
jgi:hypothetical protein